jgi:hypothetical protein
LARRIRTIAVASVGLPTLARLMRDRGHHRQVRAFIKSLRGPQRFTATASDDGACLVTQPDHLLPSLPVRDEWRANNHIDRAASEQPRTVGQDATSSAQRDWHDRASRIDGRLECTESERQEFRRSDEGPFRKHEHLPPFLEQARQNIRAG